MYMDSIELTIHIDTKHSVEEVWDYLLYEAFGEDFHPMYLSSLGNQRESIHSEQINHPLHATYLDELPEPAFSHTDLASDHVQLCGAFRIKLSGEEKHFMHFLLPELGDEDGIPVLEWNYPDPAITLLVSIHEYDSGPIFYTTLSVSHGLWGTRHNWIESMLNVLKRQGQTDGTVIESLVNDLRDNLPIIKDFETRILAQARVQDRIWNAARTIIERFSSGAESSFVSPTIATDAPSPYDLQTYVPGRLSDEPLSIPQKTWNQIAWHETLTWGAPEVIQNRTIQYWSQHHSDKEFLEMIRLTNLGWKATWPAIVRIISMRPETPLMISELLARIADPNWPGAAEAMVALSNIDKEKTLPIIDESIRIAQRNGDEWWEEILTDLKSDIIAGHR